MALIEFKDVTFHYSTETESAISHCSFSVEEGEFAVITGPSGCGKSTILKLLKPEITPAGNQTGEYYYKGMLMNKQTCLQEHTRDIGYVSQNPDNQIVSETVKTELIFGMENFGLPTNEMRIRLAEITELLGLSDLLNMEIQYLSGGQKQLVNLAAIILLQPNVILLDEPTSQLDPINAKELINFLKRLNDEFGITIILVEHRIEEVIKIADRLILMNNGNILYNNHPRQVILDIWEYNDDMLKQFIPVIPLLYLNHTFGVNHSLEIPLTIKEARSKMDTSWMERDHPKKIDIEDKVILECNNLHFQYGKKQRKIIENLSLTLISSSILTIFGNNGAGKSTLLKLLSGIYTPQLGKIKLNNKKVRDSKLLLSKVGYLPQQPIFYFTQDSIEEELNMVKNASMTTEAVMENLVKQLNLDPILKKHPHDCSGGEIQKAAIACILLSKPRILLLDEPTKGLDPVSKYHLSLILRRLKANGTSILIVSHDTEFAAINSDFCGLMFEGNIVSIAPTQEFIHSNFFYTTVEKRLMNLTRLKEKW